MLALQGTESFSPQKKIRQRMQVVQVIKLNSCGKKHKANMSLSRVNFDWGEELVVSGVSKMEKMRLKKGKLDLL